jgi:hypothetical protein
MMAPDMALLQLEVNEKAMTKTGGIFVALVDADRIDYQHLLERERIHDRLLMTVRGEQE